MTDHRRFEGIVSATERFTSGCVVSIDASVHGKGLAVINRGTGGLKDFPLKVGDMVWGTYSTLGIDAYQVTTVDKVYRSFVDPKKESTFERFLRWFGVEV